MSDAVPDIGNIFIVCGNRDIFCTCSGEKSENRNRGRITGRITEWTRELER